MNEVSNVYGHDYYVGEIDGTKCQTLKSFLTEIAIAFNFPSYYGNNINAFWDCIGDLSWIEEKQYALVIRNVHNFLKSEDEDIKSYIFDLLQKVAKDWANVPNFEGENKFREKADFKIITLE